MTYRLLSFERLVLLLHTTPTTTKTSAIDRMITISTTSTGTPAVSTRFWLTGDSVGGGKVGGGCEEGEGGGGGGGEEGGGGGGGGGTAETGGTRED